MRASADNRSGHSAKTGLTKAIFAPTDEFGRHLVIPVGSAWPRDDLIIVQPKGQEHRLFKPLIDGPLATDLFGHPPLAGIQQRERGIDCIAHDAGRCGADCVAGLPSGIDDGFKLCSHRQTVSIIPVSQWLRSCVS